MLFNLAFGRQHIIIIMENEHFTTLISQIQQNDRFSNLLKYMQRKYHIKLYKITELSSKSVTEKYHTLQKKFYISRQTPKAEYWYQNELRLFIWVYFAYLYVFSKQQKDLREQDWNYFSSIFNHKQPVFFQFQIRSIVKLESRSPPWCPAEATLLEQIINQQVNKNHWNSIARELFIKSHKRFFRTPKQCREKWTNHLDPSKIHTEWKVSEDLILLNTIKKKGKRWSLAVKQLRNTRTEHMVKNRYKSLIINERRRFPDKKDAEIENLLIKKLKKLQTNLQKEDEKDVDQAVVTSIKSPIESCLNQKPIFLKKDEQACTKNGNYNLSQKIESLQKKQKSSLMQQQHIKHQEQAFVFQITDPDDGLKLNSPLFTPLMGAAYQTCRMSLQSDGQDYPNYQFQSLQHQDILKI